MSNPHDDAELREKLRDVLFKAAGGISDMADDEIDTIMQLFQQRDAQIRIDENMCWLTVLSPSFDANVAYMDDFQQRIKELTNQAKGETKP